MPIRFAINGLGRIGRALTRIAAQRDDLLLVAANDQADPLAIARLLQHDTVHRCFPGTVTHDGDSLHIAGRPVRLFRESEPGRIPWASPAAGGPQIVVEATGRFRSRPLAAPHLGGPVER
ncbi:MAG: glyceraldehyde 3-phosphate dehydrogenase NAD-binding domain-containing protein, partial [Acidobacteriota bacterium]